MNLRHFVQQSITVKPEICVRNTMVPDFVYYLVDTVHVIVNTESE